MRQVTTHPVNPQRSIQPLGSFWRAAAKLLRHRKPVTVCQGVSQSRRPDRGQRPPPETRVDQLTDAMEEHIGFANSQRILVGGWRGVIVLRAFAIVIPPVQATVQIQLTPTQAWAKAGKQHTIEQHPLSLAPHALA